MSKIKFIPLIEEIHRLSKKVSSDLPFHATGIEKQLQEALAYEFRKAPKSVEAVREFSLKYITKIFPSKTIDPTSYCFLTSLGNSIKH